MSVPPLHLADQWLSLGQASRLLDVSPSTLRYWCDQGRVACARTPGGHRRFHHADIQALKAQMAAGPDADEPPTPMAGILNRIQQVVRCEIRENDARRIQGDLREEQRRAGQALLGLAVQYAARRDDAPAVLAEARRNGAETGRRLASLQYSLPEMLEAHFTYAGRIERLILPELVGNAGLSAEQLRVEQRLRHFFQQVLLAMADTFVCEPRPSSSTLD